MAPTPYIAHTIISDWTNTCPAEPYSWFGYNGSDWEHKEPCRKVFRGLWVTAKEWIVLIKEASVQLPEKEILPTKSVDVLKRRQIIHQPCWSANRWKSLT